MAKKVTRCGQQLIVEQVRRTVAERHWDMSPLDGCIYFAGYLTQALWEMKGVRSFVQGGSCGWPRIPNAAPDDEAACMAYAWEPDSPTTRKSLERGLLPEIHAWVGIPETMEIVDVTTAYWPARMKRDFGWDWPGDLPPDYLWATCDDWPEGVWYDSCPLATDLVMRLFALGRAGPEQLRAAGAAVFAENSRARWIQFGPALAK